MYMCLRASTCIWCCLQCTPWQAAPLGQDRQSVTDPVARSCPPSQNSSQTCVCMRLQNQLMSRLSGGSMETHGQSVVEWCLNKAMVEWCLNKAMWAVRPAGACVIRDWQHHLLDHPEQDKLNTDCQAQVHVQSVTGSITSLIILSRPKSAHTHLLDHPD